MHFVYKEKTNHLSKMKFAPQKNQVVWTLDFFPPHKQFKAIIQLCIAKPVNILIEECAIHVTKIQAPYC